MTNIVSLDQNLLHQLVRENTANETLIGLRKGKVGFVLSAPDTGKGYLLLSIAYELATTIKLIGVSNNTKPLKVLYWPIEDGLDGAAERIVGHFSQFDLDMIGIIQENLKIWSSNIPICCSKRSSLHEKEEVLNNLNNLCDEAKEFDLVIIDTIREAAGSADEVEDDYAVKTALQTVARDADVAVLVSHHLTKAATRGQEEITSVSGSGFSRTIANSRLVYFLKASNKGKKDQKKVMLSHIKANHVPERLKMKDRLLNWSDSSLVFYKEENRLAFEMSSFDVKSLEDMTVNLPDELEEPLEITLDDYVMSEESTIKAKQNREENRVLSDEDVDEYKLFLRNKDARHD